MGIEIKNLTHTYSPGMPDEFTALKDVSLTINDGEIVAVIGHTGSGKSTLLQHLNGLLKPTSGTIWIDDVDITDPSVLMRDIRRKVGLVFQYPEYQLFEETVEKDIMFGPRNLGLSEDEMLERVKESLELVGLDYNEVGDRSPFALSGGQKRRVAIAGVIAMKPKALILDEPTAGLDPGAHKDILSMIENIHDREKNIIVFVSHNMADVAHLADRIFVMDQGMLAMEGTPEEVFSRRAELEAIGLSVPPVTGLVNDLADRGASLSRSILDLEDAKSAILSYLKSI